MPRIAREGDTCDHGGAPIGVAGKGYNPTVTVNGKPIAINNGVGDGSDSQCGLWQEGQTGSPGDDVHPLGRKPGGGSPGKPGPTGGSGSVFVAGVPVHRFHDSRGCGAETTTSSPNVWADSLAEIRAEGGTVTSSIASPAAPKLFAYPPLFFYSFSFEGGKSWGPDIKPGTFYIPKKDKENYLFSKDIFSELDIWNINLQNFEEWGTDIMPTLEFEDVDPQFGVPDIDFARRTDLALTDVEFAGGLTAVGFPSYGNVDITNLGKISGVVDNDSLCTLDAWWQVDASSPLGNIQLIRTVGYPFMVANESGKVTARAILITLPWSRFHFVGP